MSIETASRQRTFPTGDHGIHWLVPATGLVVGAATFLGTLTAEFAWDDLQIIVNNPKVVGEASWRELLLTDLWTSVSSQSSFYRPLPLLAFRGLFKLFGLNPAAFHGLNVAIHAFNSALVSTFTWYCLRTTVHRARLAGAIAAGLLFAVHPVHTQAVAWISGVMDVGATFFSLLALTIHVRCENSGRRQAAICLTVLLALLTKEVAIGTLAVLVALDIIEWRTLPRSGPSLLRRWYALGGVVLSYFTLRTVALGSAVFAGGHTSHGFVYLLANIPPLVVRYLMLLVVPYPLTAVPEVKAHSSFVSPVPLCALLLIGIAAAGATQLIHKYPRHLLPILLVALPLAPSLVMIASAPTSEIHNAVGDRYLYMPTVGLSLGVGLGISALQRRHWALVLGALSCVGALFGAMTIIHARHWQSDLTLWRHNVEVHPALPLARLNLAAAYRERGQFGLAARELEQLGTIDARSDQVARAVLTGAIRGNRGDPNGAVRSLREASILAPNSADVLYNLGVALENAGLVDESVDAYERCLSFRPLHPDANNNLGVLQARRGRYARAAALFRTALIARSGDADAQRNLARVTELLRMSEPTRSR